MEWSLRSYRDSSRKLALQWCSPYIPFLDTLLWKYNIEDHQFLMDKSIFNILRGMENETLKGAWGKSYLLEETNNKDNTNKRKQSLRETNSLFANYLTRGTGLFERYNNTFNDFVIMENDFYYKIE